MTPALSVSVRWRGGTLAFASAHGDVVRVAPPARLAEGAGCWSPEELLAGAAASSFALELEEMVERRDLTLVDATLKAACVVSGRDIERVRIDAVLETLPGCEDDVREAAAVAEHAPVRRAVGVPVDIHVRVHANEAIATQHALAR